MTRQIKTFTLPLTALQVGTSGSYPGQLSAQGPHSLTTLVSLFIVVAHQATSWSANVHQLYLEIQINTK